MSYIPAGLTDGTSGSGAGDGNAGSSANGVTNGIRGCDACAPGDGVSSDGVPGVGIYGETAGSAIT